MSGESIPALFKRISGADDFEDFRTDFEDFTKLIGEAEAYLAKVDEKDEDWSEKLLRIFVDEPERLAHSLMVGLGCAAVARVINEQARGKRADESLLRHAGTLHDIGQRHTTEGTTPWHELMGAVYARGLGLPEISQLISTHATVPEGLVYFKRNVPEWVETPQSLEEKILAVVDFLILQGGQPVALDTRLQDIYERFQGEPPAKITQAGEERFKSMFKEVNGLTGERLDQVLQGVADQHLAVIRERTGCSQ